MEWDDQIVIAIGTNYEVNDKLSLRGGFNYASNPVPAETVIPIFPAVVESHVTLGVGYKFTSKFALQIGYEFVPKTELDVETSTVANEYDGSTSSLSENVIHITTSIKF